MEKEREEYKISLKDKLKEDKVPKEKESGNGNEYAFMILLLSSRS